MSITMSPELTGRVVTLAKELPAALAAAASGDSTYLRYLAVQAEALARALRVYADRVEHEKIPE